MAGPALQLFPPPQRPRQMSPNRSPTSRKLRVKTSTPEPSSATEKMESAKSTKAPVDFHELIIQVNSVPVSPSASVTAPPRAHIPNTGIVRTPPQQSMPTFDSPPRPRTASPSSNQISSPPQQDPRAPSPSLSVYRNVRDSQRYQTASPEPYRAGAASPAFSELRSNYSASPTLVRANSSATNMTSRSPQEEVPMRSIFPVYDPTVPLAHQPYKPTQASPTHIPRNQISRSPYSPEFYVPHGNVAGTDASTSAPPKPFFTPSNLLDSMWVACNGQEEPTVQIYTLRMHRPTAVNPDITFGPTPSLPFYSLAQSNLAGNNEVQSIMHELMIKRHHPTQPRALPIAHLDLTAPPPMDQNTYGLSPEPVTLLTSIYPKLAALAALDAAAQSPAASHIALTDPEAQSPAAQRLAQDVLLGAAQRECCALAWTRDPAPSSPPPTNPWAHALPTEGSYQLHHPTLGTFPVQIEGDCSVLNKPSTRPVTAFYGHNMPSTPQLNAAVRKPASITLLNPYILSPTSPRANAFNTNYPPPPPRMDSLIGRPASITPSELDSSQLASTTDANPDDAVLARLDFTNDALTLNLGALTRFGNPFLADVAVSTLLAVAVAEAVRKRNNRKRSQENFEPPPPSSVLGQQGPSTAKQFGDSFVEGFNSWGGSVGGKKTASLFSKFTAKSGAESTKSHSLDKDIELGEWYGQSKAKEPSTKAQKKSKKEKDHDGLPFVTRTIIGVLTFGFKAVVFVLKVAIKIVAGVIVMITRNFSKL